VTETTERADASNTYACARDYQLFGPGPKRISGFETLNVTGGPQVDYVGNATKHLPLVQAETSPEIAFIPVQFSPAITLPTLSDSSACRCAPPAILL